MMESGISELTLFIFLLFEDCPTTDLELINGNFSGPTINVGENLHFMCHQGFSKPSVNLTCQGSGEIQNVDRMACCESYFIFFKLKLVYHIKCCIRNISYIKVSIQVTQT